MKGPYSAVSSYRDYHYRLVSKEKPNVAKS